MTLGRAQSPGMIYVVKIEPAPHKIFYRGQRQRILCACISPYTYKKKAAGNIVVGRVMSEFSQSSYLYVPCARGPLCVFWRLLARTPGAMEDMARAREAWSRLAHLGRGDIDAGMFRRTKVCAQERSPIPVSEMVVAGACLLYTSDAADE